jgi:selenocysteine lyase/cysteine desulfurase
MLPDGHLDLDRFAGLLDEHTRVAAVTLASNGLGTILRLPEAVRLVRERAPRALVVVDAVHGAPHVPIDVQALGVDALAFSTYKLFGPFCGVLWLREGLLPALQPFHVKPHTDPETLLEWGTLNNVTVGGIRSALQDVETLGETLEPLMIGAWPGYERRERRFKLALAAIQAFEAEISTRVLEAVAELPRVRVYGVTDPAAVTGRVPTFGFEIDGVPDAELEARFWDAGHVQIAAGTHYSAAVLRGLGRPSLGRASFAHYNDEADVEAFLSALRAVAA